MEHTDEEILIALKAKKDRLAPEYSRAYAEMLRLDVELRKVNMAIAAFEPSASSIAAAIEPQKETGIPNNTTPVATHNHEDDSDDAIPNVFSDELSYNKKIFFVLKTRGPSTVNDIVDYIVNIQPNIDRDKLHKRVTTATSQLNIKHKIKARKVGNKNKYYLVSK